MKLYISLSATGTRSKVQQKHHDMLMSEHNKLSKIEGLQKELKKLGETHAKAVKAIPKGSARAKAVETKNQQFKAKKESIRKKIAAIQATRKSKMSRATLNAELKDDHQVSRNESNRRLRRNIAIVGAVGAVGHLAAGALGV